ncbi:MAG: DNA (cytosine-5-)-methyltransferase [Eubacteriales bacterium]
MSDKLRVASLFAGMGGIDLAFQEAGFEIVWANEIDGAACRTYRHNFGSNHLMEGNISKVNPRNIPDFDVLTAGFPCQPFSIGGLQRGFQDRRGNLFFEIARVLDVKRPPFVFLENVANLMEHDHGRTFLVIYNTLVEFGYVVKYHVMPSFEYGNLPQTRSRIFLVAFLDLEQCNRFQFPEPLPLTTGINDIINRSEKKHDIYYYESDSPLYPNLCRIVNDSDFIFHNKDRGIIKVRNRMCPTLTANMGTYPNRVPVVCEQFGIRKLTLRECLDFQGFPQTFYFPNSIKIEDAYKQIGNSVSVPVIERIARNLGDIC